MGGRRDECGQGGWSKDRFSKALQDPSTGHGLYCEAKGEMIMIQEIDRNLSEIKGL